MNGLYFYCFMVGFLGAAGCVLAVIPLWIKYTPGKNLTKLVAATIALLALGGGFALLGGWGAAHAPSAEVK